MEDTSFSFRHAVLHIATVSPSFKGTGFPPLVEHVPVSAVLLKLTKDGISITDKTVSSLKEEESLIRFFFSELEGEPYNLVTFRGRSFAFPVMVYRALRYGVTASSYLGNDYQDASRSEAPTHLDISDWLTSYGLVASSSLSKYSEMVGLPPRPYSNNVTSQFERGDSETLGGTLTTDVMLISALFMRILLSKGDIPRETYTTKTKAMLKAFFNHNKETKTYINSAQEAFKEFLLLPPKKQL